VEVVELLEGGGADFLDRLEAGPAEQETGGQRAPEILAAEIQGLGKVLFTRLVTKATRSSLRPWTWRRSKAPCSAKGKPICMPVRAAVRRERLSGRPLLISWVRA
jgi:hypothetical protein